MKRLYALSFALMFLCTAHAVSFAQVVSIDANIITFDKLSKTVIPFVASAQPTVTTEPSLEGQYTLTFADGKGTLTFTKPVSEGSYKIRLSASGKTTETSWKVLPTRLDSKSMRVLANPKLYYGKRLSFRGKLPIEAELPLQQFKIDYQIGSETPSEGNSFSQSYVGPNIPASAKTVKISIVWVYPMTGERVTLFTKEIQPEQTPPEISCWNNSIAELTKFDAPTNTYFVAVRGISVDYEVPLDADNTDIDRSKSIRATLADVKAEPASLDYNAPETNVRVYRDDTPIPESSWTANPSTFKIVKGDYDSASGTFLITIAVSGLPTFGTQLRGTIAIQAKAKIVNQKAGANAMSQNPPCILPLTLPINTHITNTEQIAAMQLAAKSYIPTTTKTVRLAGSEFLKRQYWLSSRLRNQDFSLFTANEATIQTVRNIISSPPLRTPELEFAEKQCTTTDDIKRRFSKKLPIPQAMIDEGGDPAACETVKQFYSQVMSYEAVSHVVMLVSKPTGGKTAELLGALALGGRDKLIIRDTDLAAPLHIYSPEDLKVLRIDGSTTFYDMLAKQLTNLDAGLLERNVTVETIEVVPVSSKGSTLKKGK